MRHHRQQWIVENPGKDIPVARSGGGKGGGKSRGKGKFRGKGISRRVAVLEDGTLLDEDLWDKIEYLDGDEEDEQGGA